MNYYLLNDWEKQNPSFKEWVIYCLINIKKNVNKKIDGWFIIE